jgi:transposase
VSREHRRVKTDRLDTELLMRAFLGWLRGERRHCSMAAIPTIEEEDAKRPNREREKLVGERTRTVNRIKATLARLVNLHTQADLTQCRRKARWLAHQGRGASS